MFFIAIGVIVVATLLGAGVGVCFRFILRKTVRTTYPELYLIFGALFGAMAGLVIAVLLTS